MQDAFARLGLAPGADAMDIRKAYARELKKIDQENDIAGFQALRRAYDIARGHGMVMPQPKTAASALSQNETGMASEAARTAFIEFTKIMAAAEDFEEATWEKALRQVLDSELLLNLDARIHFEAAVVHRLAQGWKPGHEWLLAAAAKVWGWNGTQQHLSWFQQSGNIINRALNEQRLLAGMPLAERAMLHALIVRLRQPDAPRAAELHQYNRTLKEMNRLFPVLTVVAVDNATFQHWLANSKEAPPLPPPPSEPKLDSSPVLSGGLLLRALFMIAFVLILKQCAGHKNPQAPEQPRTPENMSPVSSD